jgi:hypothetical protein
MKYTEKIYVLLWCCVCSVGLQGTWADPVLVSKNYCDATTGKISFNRSGLGFAVFPQATGLFDDGVPSPVMLSRYNGTLGMWSSQEMLEQLGQSNFGDADPKVAFDAQGNGLIVFARGNNELSNSSIVALNYVDGKMQPIRFPSILSEAYAVAPQLAMAPDGTAIVAWVVANIDTYSCYIQAAYYDGVCHDWVKDGSGAVIVKTIKDNIQFLDPYLPFVQLGMDDQHRALMVWSELSYDDISLYTSNVYALSYDGSDWASWNPGGPVQLSQLNGYNSIIAMNETGDALVIWAGTSENVYPELPLFTIQAVRYDAATQDFVRQSGTIVIKNLQASVYPFYIARPQAAIDSQGNCVILWDDFPIINFPQIKAVHYNMATDWIGWTPSLQTIRQGYVLLPTVAMDSEGNAMSVWMEIIAPYGNLILKSSFYDASVGTWGSSEFVVDDFEHDIGFYMSQDDWPLVTFDGTGKAHAMWTQSDGRVNRCNIATYSPTGVSKKTTVNDQELDLKLINDKKQMRRHLETSLKRHVISKRRKIHEFSANKKNFSSKVKE